MEMTLYLWFVRNPRLADMMALTWMNLAIYIYLVKSSPTQTSHTMLTRIMPSSSRLALMPIRTFTTIPSLLAARKNFDRPSPPPLPPSDQAEFDALLKANQSIGASPAITSPGEEVQHRDLRRGPKKDFEGDVDPKTGERGGPKVDPFKAGDQDWQYGGRVTVIRFTVALSEGQELTWLGRSGLLKHCHPIQPPDSMTLAKNLYAS